MRTRFERLCLFQDWDFPTFTIDPLIKLPGWNVANIKFKLCCIAFEIKGKWFAYGLVGMVLLIDTWMWKNQVFYEPLRYGQYTDGRDFIYSITDREFIATANATAMSFPYRKLNDLFQYDEKMNSKFKEYSMISKIGAWFPVCMAFLAFLILGIKFSREDKKDMLIKKKREGIQRRKKRVEEMRKRAGIGLV